MSQKLSWDYTNADEAIRPLIEALKGSAYVESASVSNSDTSWTGTEGTTFTLPAGVPHTGDEQVVLEVVQVDADGTLREVRVVSGGVLDATADLGYIPAAVTSPATATLILEVALSSSWSRVNSPVVATSPLTFSITAAGSGYTVSDSVYVAGGSRYDGAASSANSATFTVATVDGSGGITGLTAVQGNPSFPYYGLYEDLEDGTYSLTGGTGAGASIDITIPTTVPTDEGAQYVFRSDSGAQFSMGRVADFTAFYDLTSSDTHFSLALESFPVHDPNLDVYAQANRTTTHESDGSVGTYGTFMHGRASVGSCRAVITDRSVVWAVKNTGSDWVMYAGLSNPYTLLEDNSFPMILSATGQKPSVTNVGQLKGGPSNPMYESSLEAPNNFWDGTQWVGYGNASSFTTPEDYSAPFSSGYGTWPNLRSATTSSTSIGTPTVGTNADITEDVTGSATTWTLTVPGEDFAETELIHPVNVVGSGGLVGELQDVWALQDQQFRHYEEDYMIRLFSTPQTNYTQGFSDFPYPNANGISFTGGLPVLNDGGAAEIRHTDTQGEYPTTTTMGLSKGDRFIVRGKIAIRGQVNSNDFFGIFLWDPANSKSDLGTTIALPTSYISLRNNTLGMISFNRLFTTTGSSDYRVYVSAGPGGTIVGGSMLGTLTGSTPIFPSGATGSGSTEFDAGTCVLEYGTDGYIRAMLSTDSTYLDKGEYVSYDDWPTTTGFSKTQSAVAYDYGLISLGIYTHGDCNIGVGEGPWSYDRDRAYTIENHWSKQTAHHPLETGDSVNVPGRGDYEVIRNGSQSTSLTLIRK